MLWTKAVLAVLFATATNACVCRNSATYPFKVDNYFNAGTVKVESEQQNGKCAMKITYNTEGTDYCLHTTNLHVGKAKDVTYNSGKNAKPKISAFDPGDVIQATDQCIKSYTYELYPRCTKDVDVAAHALVYQSAARFSLPQDVDVEAHDGSDSTLDLVVNDQNDDPMSGWFFDYPSGKSPPDVPGAPGGKMKATVHSSLVKEVQERFSLQDAWVKGANWLLNNVIVGQEVIYPNGSAIPTADDIQKTIWLLLKMGQIEKGGELGVANNIMELALEEGVNFEAKCDDKVVVIVEPEAGGKLKMVAEMEMADFTPDCSTGPTKDGWALGCKSKRFGKKYWSAYNTYECDCGCSRRERHLR